MERPIISCDVSKGNSHIRGFIGLSNAIGDPFVVHHVKSELKLIKELAKSLENQAHQKVAFVFEYTGVYHESIVRYALKIGLIVYAISPLESAKVRKSSIRPVKTDSRDCTSIAETFYKREEKHLNKPYVSDQTDLKALSRHRRSLLDELRAVKCTYRRYLDLIWPCLDLYFKEVTGKIITTVVRVYHHPGVLKRRTSQQIAEVLENNGHCSYKRGLSIADKLKDYALDSMSGVDEKSEYVNCLTSALDRIIDLEKRVLETDKKMDRLLNMGELYGLIKSIPGIGEKLSMIISAELGDYTRFKTAKQLVAYIGLDPHIDQSGNDDGEHRSITRKGNSILRSSLYLAVTCMLGQYDNQITKFYYQKKSSGLPHKVAAVATCRKLACTIFGMFTSGVCFETK